VNHIIFEEKVRTEYILGIFLLLRFSQHLVERFLASSNRKYYSQKNKLTQASEVLNINASDMEKTLTYSLDKSQFGSISSWASVLISLGFIGFGGLGWLEQQAQSMASTFTAEPSQTIVGLCFFLLVGILSYISSVPFELWNTFVIEEKHGFNKQTPKGFVLDLVKGTSISIILGGGLLYALLSIMESAGNYWWLGAWLLTFGFSLLTAWLYPTLLAPLFNKFEPLKPGELKDKIFDLAQKIEFAADSISIMDASTRTSHGNAYFTGVFGKKKIVLFDTLIKSMNTSEIVAVLAHELGHFKLNHIRWSLIRSFFMTGFIFWLLSLCLPLIDFYKAFNLSGVSNWAALVVFSLWFGPVGFLLQPITNHLSRKNEFAADAFALEHIQNKKLLGDALLKLRENSHVMPISDPAFSAVYHSHPPLMERLEAMGYLNTAEQK